MPFEQVTTIRYTGPLNESEKFSIDTTAGNYIGGAAFTEYPRTALCLHRDHWPKPVDEAAVRLLHRIGELCGAAAVDDVTAWIKNPERLVVGADSICIKLRWGFSRLNEPVMLEGTIISFTPL